MSHKHDLIPPPPLWLRNLPKFKGHYLKPLVTVHTIFVQVTFQRKNLQQWNIIDVWIENTCINTISRHSLMSWSIISSGGSGRADCPVISENISLFRNWRPGPPCTSERAARRPTSLYWPFSTRSRLCVKTFEFCDPSKNLDDASSAKASLQKY